MWRLLTVFVCMHVLATILVRPHLESSVRLLVYTGSKYYESLSLDEKRKHYACKYNYVTLDQIESWSITREKVYPSKHSIIILVALSMLLCISHTKELSDVFP